MPTLPVLRLPHSKDLFLDTKELTLHIKSKSVLLFNTKFQASLKFKIQVISSNLTFDTFMPSKIVWFQEM